MINDTPPNIRRMDASRSDVYAFEITGYVENADIENLYGLLHGAHEVSPQIDTLFLFHDYEGVDWGEAWTGQALFDKADALQHIGKCAIVGAPAWVQAGLSLLRPFVQAEIRLFSEEEAADAWEWIGAEKVPPAETKSPEG